MPTIYPPLRHGAPARLAAFNREALKPGWVRPMSGRDVRFATLKSRTGFDSGRTFGAPCYYGFHVSGYFRDIRDAHDIVRSLPRGWYTDMHQDETAIGIVARISHGRFIAGYRWTSNDETVIFPQVYEDEDEAARAADSHAERFAEDSRDDSERFDAMSDAKTAADDAAEFLRDAWALRRQGRRSSDQVREAIEALREARETLREATEAYNRGA